MVEIIIRDDECCEMLWHATTEWQDDAMTSFMNKNRQNWPYITTHSQIPIFCNVSRVDTGCLECYRPYASVDTTTPKIDHKHII